jgi:hypothetical protein
VTKEPDRGRPQAVATLFNAATAGVAGVYLATRSVAVTALSAGCAAIVAGLYLARRGRVPR